MTFAPAGGLMTADARSVYPPGSIWLPRLKSQPLPGRLSSDKVIADVTASGGQMHRRAGSAVPC
jgi:hypothetical protein